MDNNELHKRGVDDQFSFNALMTSDFRPGHHPAIDDEEIDVLRLVGSQQPLPRVESDQKVFYAAPGGSLKLMVLPSALFAGTRHVQSDDEDRVPALWLLLFVSRVLCSDARQPATSLHHNRSDHSTD